MALELYKPEEATRSRGGLAVCTGALLLYGILSLYEWLGSFEAMEKDFSNRMFGDEFPLNARVLIAALLLLSCAISIYIGVNNQRAVEFLIATEAEMAKVAWPTKQEVFNNSLVVIIVTILIGIYLGVVDVGLAAFKNNLPWDTFWGNVFGGGA
jgi:preprotein translocase subunit SecE